MNNVSLTGRLTKDLELKNTNSGTSVLKFSLAVRRPFKKDETDFINCIAWGKSAETMSQYLNKGSLIGVNGYIQTGSYQKQDGTKVNTTDVVVNAFDFLESSKSSNQSSNAQANNNNHFEDVDNSKINDYDLPF